MRIGLRPLFGFLVFAILCFAVPAAAQGQICGQYTVAAGDTLTRIAQSQGTTVEAIVAANGILNPSSIFAGQVLQIPCSNPNGQAPAWPPLVAIRAENALSIVELYRTSLPTVPLRLALSYEDNTGNGIGRAAILDDTGVITLYPLSNPSAPSGTIVGQNGSFIYQMAAAYANGAVASAESDMQFSGTLVEVANFLGDSSQHIEVPIPLGQGLRLTDMAMDSGLLVTTNANDEPYGIYLYGLMHSVGPEPFIPHDGRVIGVQLDQDSSLLATASMDGSIRIWDLSGIYSMAEPTPPVLVNTLTDSINTETTFTPMAGADIIAFSPDNQLLAFGDGMGTLWLWNFQTNAVRHFPAFINSPIQNVIFSEDGSLLAVTAGYLPTVEGGAPIDQDNSIHLYDVAAVLQSDEERPGGVVLNGPVDAVTGLAFAPGGNMLVATGADRTLWIWGVVDTGSGATVVQPQPTAVLTQDTALVTRACDNAFFFGAAPSQDCVSSPAVSTPAVYQSFDNGFMMWFSDTKSILVLYYDMTGYLYSDAWAGQMVITDQLPPEGHLQPDRGFGWLWTQTPGMRDHIGWATAAEVSYNATYQAGFIQSPGPRPPGVSYYTLPDGSLARVRFDDGAASWGWAG